MAAEPKIKKYTKNVKVYVQILPTVQESWEDVKISNDKKSLSVRSTKDFGKGKENDLPNYLTFMTDGILYHLNQYDIFEKLVKESLKKALKNQDLLVFAYGQTGTGKSTTINGLFNNYKCRGLTPRILSELFNSKKNFKFDTNAKFYVSYVEIHESYVMDLLNIEGTGILHNPFKELQVIKIRSEDDGIKLLFRGESNRSIIYKKYMSNKFTSVFTIHIKNISRLVSHAVVNYSKIHIIDMAGTDSGGSISCIWKKAKEVGIGNLNKSQLELCLLNIQKDVITNTKSINDAGILVSYLGKSLNAESLIKFIGHIRSNRESLIATTSTLRFLNIIRRIKCPKMKSFIQDTPHLQVESLAHDIIELKGQMYLQSMMMNADLSYDITQLKTEKMQNAVENFTKDKTDSILLLNITDADIAINVFKQLLLKLEKQVKELKKEHIFDSDILTDISTKTHSFSFQQQFNIGAKVSSKSLKSVKSIIKKRASSDKTSRVSRTSNGQIGKMQKSSTVIKPGVTLNELMSYNYEGDVTKSLKLKTKYINKSLIERSPTEQGINVRVSQINLPSFGDDYDNVWNDYMTDENFSFTTYNEDLKKVEQNTQNILKEFNQQVKNLQEQVQAIDSKKSDLLKVQTFQCDNFECDYEESVRLVQAEEQMTLHIKELLINTIHIKEDLLNLQSEIKININDYHRIKNEIVEDFKLYCIATCKVELPVITQLMDDIEDKISYYRKHTECVILEEKSEISLFYKYQREMKKTIEKRLGISSHITC